MVITKIISHETLESAHNNLVANPSFNNPHFTVVLGYNETDSQKRIFDAIGTYTILEMLSSEFTFDFFTKDFPVSPFYGDICDVSFSKIAFRMTDMTNTLEASERIFRFIYPVRFPDGSIYIVQRDTRLGKMISPYTGLMDDVMVMDFIILSKFDGKDFVPKAEFICPETNLVLKAETIKLKVRAARLITEKLFSPKEYKFVSLLSEHSYEEVGKELNKSPNTIKTDRANLLRRKRSLFYSEFGFGMFRSILDGLKIC